MTSSRSLWQSTTSPRGSFITWSGAMTLLTHAGRSTQFCVGRHRFAQILELLVDGKQIAPFVALCSAGTFSGAGGSRAPVVSRIGNPGVFRTQKRVQVSSIKGPVFDRFMFQFSGSLLWRVQAGKVIRDCFASYISHPIRGCLLVMDRGTPATY